MARKGEKIITQNEVETKVRNINTRIDSILSFLVFIEGVEKKNFMIQCGHDEFAGLGSAISFPIPFKTGTAPIVVAVSIAQNKVAVLSGAPTATGFSGYGRLISDGSNYTTNAGWIAIGERG